LEVFAVDRATVIYNQDDNNYCGQKENNLEIPEALKKYFVVE